MFDLIASYTNLKTFIFLGGLAHLAILSAGLVMTKVLKWREELPRINELSQHVIWTHAAYVWFTIMFFGLVSVLFSADLSSPSRLGGCLNLFIALFWGARLIIQFFYFDAKPYLNTIIDKLGFHALTFNFAYFTAVYGYAAAVSFAII